MISIIIFLFMIWSFCKAVGDSDDKLEKMWEQYLRDKKLEIEDQENARLENERNEKLDREDEEANDERWRIWKGN
jgi:hypothetical protein